MYTSVFNVQTYPLARNINNSPGIFSCIRAGANTGATCIRPEIISLKNLANMQKMTPQKYFLARIQAPHVFAEKLIPQEFFPACIGFVPGGIVWIHIFILLNVALVNLLKFNEICRLFVFQNVNELMIHLRETWGPIAPTVRTWSRPKHIS